MSYERQKHNRFLWLQGLVNNMNEGCGPLKVQKLDWNIGGTVFFSNNLASYLSSYWKVAVRRQEHECSEMKTRHSWFPGILL